MPQRATMPSALSFAQFAVLVASQVACAGPLRFHVSRFTPQSMVASPQWCVGRNSPDQVSACAIMAVLFLKLQSTSHEGNGHGALVLSMHDGDTGMRKEQPARVKVTSQM